MWTVSDAGYGISLPSKGRERLVTNKKIEEKKGREDHKNEERGRCETPVETHRTPVT